MSAQLPIDFTAARAARDAGIAAAVEHADHVEPKWSDTAYDFLVGYLPSVETLTSEDVREASRGVVSDPPSLRAWGGVFMRAARAGLIERAGYGTARDPKVHCNVVTVWRSLLFSAGPQATGMQSPKQDGSAVKVAAA